MNGAESLVRTALDAGIDLCFANPGTTEMQLVAALDSTPGMRAVLGLFEGVCTGAADGYARMARKPASTLLHLGPGLANALANVHNARKGHVPMVNIVGDHATYHVQYDAPLTADIEGIARPVSHWVFTSKSPQDIGRDAAEAVRQAGRDRIATLMLPADVSWGENSNGPEGTVTIEPAPVVPPERVAEVASRLRSGRQCLILVGGREVDIQRGLMVNRIGRATGARVMADTLPGRVGRGAGSAVLEHLPYLAEFAVDALKEVEQLILVGIGDPVSFFAYPNVPSLLAPENCERVQLAAPGEDVDQALEDLLEALEGIDVEPDVYPLDIPDPPGGALDATTVAQSIAHYLPENAVVVDEAITTGVAIYSLTATCPPHDWLNQTGGSIGWGLPAAVGAAVACPHRKVLCLEGDGSAMYTIQALWTMARENLDITVVICNNRKYSILEMEFGRTGARGGSPGPKAGSMLDIGRPDMDFVAIARGMGVQGSRATTAAEFNTQLEQALAATGPRLIDAVVPTLF